MPGRAGWLVYAMVCVQVQAVAAGGSGGNAANYSPDSEPLACTVGASTQSDSVATSSNYGAILDIYAPGQNILTTWLTGGTVCLFHFFETFLHACFR